jgi:exopolysaccharide biosynthesis polyprenyl glycosylphosphotransferase
VAARRSRTVAYSLLAVLNLGAALGILGLHSSMQTRSVFSLFVWWAIAMAAVATAVGWLIQIGDVDPLSSTLPKALYAGLKIGFVTFVLISAASALADHSVPRQVTLSFLAVSPVIGAMATWPAVVLARSAEPDRLLVIGSYDDVHQLQTELEGLPPGRARIVGHVNGFSDDTRPSEIGPWMELGRQGFADKALELRPHVAVVDSHCLEDYELLSQVTALHIKGVRIRTFVEFYEQMFGKVPISAINEAWFLFDTGELHRATYLRLKQAVDVIGAILGTIVFIALLPVIAIAIKLDTRGPVFYSQDRVGKDGRTFRLLKFRTMRKDAENDGPQWAKENDNRVTRVGAFLRRARLDELPQFINVLKGDMSLVGPRAERPEFVSTLETKIPFYSRRHLIKPGLTGWAQIKYRYGSSVEHALEKLQYEFYYMKHQSVFLDVAIIIDTLRVMLSMKGI